MPRLGHYSEKYELNGSGSEQPAASYGSFRRDEQGALLSHDHLLVSRKLCNLFFGACWFDGPRERIPTCELRLNRFFRWPCLGGRTLATKTTAASRVELAADAPQLCRAAAEAAETCGGCSSGSKHIEEQCRQRIRPPPPPSLNRRRGFALGVSTAPVVA
ncbi:hypothetical protein HPB50_000903 [Hyalomma asiaticum]|uniref:Uncharacterized protein n=1 Tax=Hyalomma asiaticum TaxID=266040 RepID=A0ACB7SAS4_HYAAI|nr:hypothetical protein HPB50_000903 [Hyalomma asiaticum]